MFIISAKAVEWDWIWGKFSHIKEALKDIWRILWVHTWNGCFHVWLCFLSRGKVYLLIQIQLYLTRLWPSKNAVAYLVYLNIYRYSWFILTVFYSWWSTLANQLSSELLLLHGCSTTYKPGAWRALVFPAPCLAQTMQLGMEGVFSWSTERLIKSMIYILSFELRWRLFHISECRTV